ncbi:ArsR family transcriptional regulator [Caldivirga maquilingensis]|uniref:Regulatory protein ArsR n=1 Tax=Caldivirga maquilingensis (strain ATCC 700844 / DSM 13496 / JCM 10307 / IC-167) TaxID=397948 RepID=A8MDN1_CALMQ|nr:ArsR family transcriptional regulator [Caldivirga maquilingensis]ABW01887.1 regulatory protein ArsR [Caldivirga maquilingensis IC-167]
MAEFKPDIIVLPGRLETSIEEGSYVIMSERNFNAIFNDINLTIVSSIAKGAHRFNEILKATSVPRGQLSRHLRALIKSGWLSKSNGEYGFSASVYVVSNVEEVNETIMIKLMPNKGAFLDPVHGLVIFRDSTGDYCSTCPLRSLCTRNVKDIANKYGIKLHSPEPAEAYMEIFRNLILINLAKRLRIGSINLRIPGNGG